MRSRSARAVRLTRYAMPDVEALEKLPRRADLALFCVLQPLTDALVGVGLGSNVEQALIGFGVLHDGRSLSLYGQHHGALGFLELFHEITRPATERRQR